MIVRLSDEYFVRNLREADVEGAYPGWFEDPEVCRYTSHGKFSRSLEYFRSFVRSLDRGDQVVWAVCHKEDGHIGNISLQGTSLVNQSAELAIILGHRGHWGRGVGVIAGRRLLAHAFDTLNLHKVHCGTAAGNIGMCKLAEALGMREEGRRREHLYLDGKWEDAVLYGVLRHEFDATRT